MHVAYNKQVIGLISLTQLVIKGESIGRQREIRIHSPKDFKARGEGMLWSPLILHKLPFLSYAKDTLSTSVPWLEENRMPEVGEISKDLRIIHEVQVAYTAQPSMPSGLLLAHFCEN